jgi:uncharacterized membrane protein YoaT (DUF817 family)
MCFKRYNLVFILCIAKQLKYIYSRYQDEANLITLIIFTGPRKAAKIMSFFDVIPKEIDALNKDHYDEKITKLS